MTDINMTDVAKETGFEYLEGLDMSFSDKKQFRANLEKLDFALDELELEIKFLELGAREENLAALKALYYNSRKQGKE